MTNPDPQQIRSVLLSRKESIEKEQALLEARASKRAAVRAENRPSRFRAAVRRQVKEEARAGQPTKQRPPKIYGEKARRLKAQVEDHVADLLLERTERIATRGPEAVVEELRPTSIEARTQAATEAARKYFDEALDRFAARLAVKEERSALPKPVGEWSEAAIGVEIRREIRLVEAGLAAMKEHRPKSADWQALCEADEGRLALLERARYTPYVESAAQFLGFLAMARDAALAGGDAQSADYWSGWQSEIARLRASVEARWPS
jgi:hypothetical protein